MGPFHHSMVCPQVVDGGYSLQIWRVAGNVLNKQSQTADKGVTAYHHKRPVLYKMLHMAL